MEFRTLEGVTVETMTNAFNEAFADYFIPFHFTPEQLASKLKADKNVLEYSVGAFENDKLVGFIFHGFEEINGIKTLYNGGTGVFKEFRGQGLTTQMYTYILPELVKAGINHITLEVIRKNIPAIRSYIQCGFKSERILSCFKGTLNLETSNAQWEIRELSDINWEDIKSMHSISPTWQNSNHVLQTLNDRIVAIAACEGDQVTGIVIYDPGHSRMHQIVVRPDYRKKGIGYALMAYIQHNYSNEISIINVDNQGLETLNFLSKIGLRKTLEQIDMRLHIQ